MRIFLAATILMVLALPAMAVDYYVRGTFGTTPDPWQDLTHQMQPDPLDPTHFTATVADPGTLFAYDYKVATADFTTEVYPDTDEGNNGRIVSDTNLEMNFHLWTNGGNPWTDGYSPKNTARVGYNDPGQFGWEVVGSFNSWPGSGDTNYYMTNDGNGVYTLTKTFNANASNYQYKFREQGSWDTSIGSNFGNHAGNNSFHVWDNGESWTFTLDLPNGRFKATTTSPNPDPTDDGSVNAADYVSIRKSNDTAAAYNRFRQHFGEVPPPPPPGFFARGQWNNFDQSNPMTDIGGGVFETTVSGLTVGQAYNYKLANADFSQDAPPGAFKNGTAVANANGEITFHLFNQTSWSDGWKPDNQRRAGYDDPLQFGWELMGDFNGFGGGATWIMNNEGAGLYSLVTPIALTAGTHAFKFRKNLNGAGDWAINIGANFENGGADAQTDNLAAGTYKFELDLRNGRWHVSPAPGPALSLVPEPASIAMAVMAMAAFGMVRRREHV